MQTSRALIAAALLSIAAALPAPASAFELARAGVTFIDRGVSYTTQGDEWVQRSSATSTLFGTETKIQYHSPRGITAVTTSYASGRTYSRVFAGQPTWGMDPHTGLDELRRQWCDPINVRGDLYMVRTHRASCTAGSNIVQTFVRTRRAHKDWDCDRYSRSAVCVQRQNRARKVVTYLVPQERWDRLNAERANEIAVCGTARGDGDTTLVFTTLGNEAACGSFAATAGRILAHAMIYRTPLYADGAYTCQISNGALACGDQTNCFYMGLPSFSALTPMRDRTVADENGPFIYWNGEAPVCSA